MVEVPYAGVCRRLSCVGGFVRDSKGVNDG